MPAKKGGSKASSNRQGGAKGSNASVDRMLDTLGVESSGGRGGRGAATGGGVDVEEVLERARNYVNEQITKARAYAKENPKLVMGSLATVVVGAGVLTAAAMAKGRKGGSSKKSSSRSSSSKGKTSGGSSKSSSKSSSSGKGAQKKR